MSDSEDEDDELDDLDDPRITELDDEEEKAPKLIKVAETIKKGKNKRRAEEEESAEDEDEDVDMADEDILKKILKAPAPEMKLSKKYGRRAFLGGATALVGLPFLEALAPRKAVG